MQRLIKTSTILILALPAIFGLISCSNGDTSAKLQSQLEAQSTQIAALQQAQVAPASPTSAQPPQIQNAVDNKPTQQPRPVDTAIPVPVAILAPSPTRTIVPSPTVQPTATFAPQPAGSSVAQVPKDENQFKSYLGNKYGTIAGKALIIKGISIYNQNDFRSVNIELDDHDATYIFAQQTKADALAYGRNLLDDTIAYFDGQKCSAYLHSTWYPSSLENYMFDKKWFDLGDYSAREHGYYLSQQYVKAYYIGGSKDVQAWNYK